MINCRQLIIKVSEMISLQKTRIRRCIFQMMYEEINGQQLRKNSPDVVIQGYSNWLQDDDGEPAFRRRAPKQRRNNNLSDGDGDFEEDTSHKTNFGVHRRPMQNNWKWLLENSVSTMQARAVMPAR